MCFLSVCAHACCGRSRNSSDNAPSCCSLLHSSLDPQKRKRKTLSGVDRHAKQTLPPHTDPRSDHFSHWRLTMDPPYLTQQLRRDVFLNWTLIASLTAMYSPQLPQCSGAQRFLAPGGSRKLCSSLQTLETHNGRTQTIQKKHVRMRVIWLRHWWDKLYWHDLTRWELPCFPFFKKFAQGLRQSEAWRL